MDLDFYHAFDCPPFADTKMREVMSRIEKEGNDFLARLGYVEENGIYRIEKPNEEKVALFCHGMFTQTWLSVLLRIPLHIMWSSFSPTHSGVTILEFKNNPDGYTAPTCLCFSDMSHLYADGLGLTHCNTTKL